MTLGMRSHGTILAIGDGGSPESFETITERFAIPELGAEFGLIDMSNHDTVDMKDYIAQALAEGDELTVECNEIPSDTAQQAVRTANTNRTKDNYKMTYTDGTYEIFEALTTRVGTDPSELDGRVVFRFKIKVTSSIARTVAP